MTVGPYYALVPKNLLPTNLELSVATLAALRATDPSSATAIEMLGYYASGDGGDGVFYSVTGAAAGTYVDNGGTIIVPTGGDGSAAWLRINNEPLNVRVFRSEEHTSELQSH